MKYLKRINELNFEYSKVDKSVDFSFQKKGDTTCNLYIEGDRAGFMHYRIEGDTFHIVWLDLSDKYKGLGNGDKIMYELESKANEEKCNKMKLQVLESNTRAVNLYKKHGFTVIEKEGFFLIMQKDI